MTETGQITEMPTRLPIPLFGAIGGLSRPLAYAIVRRGDVAAFSVGGVLYVSMAEAEALLGKITPERLCAGLRRLEDRSTAPASEPTPRKHSSQIIGPVAGHALIPHQGVSDDTPMVNTSN